MSPELISAAARDLRGRLSDPEISASIECLDWGFFDTFAKWRLRRTLLSGRLPKCSDIRSLVELGNLVLKSREVNISARQAHMPAYLALQYLSFGLCKRRMDMQGGESAIRYIAYVFPVLSEESKQMLLRVLKELTKSAHGELIYCSALALLLLDPNAEADEMLHVLRAFEDAPDFERIFDYVEIQKWRELAAIRFPQVTSDQTQAIIRTYFPWVF